MLRRLRSFVLIVIAAIGGAACGRAVAEMREPREPGLDAPAPRSTTFAIRPQDVVPGIVAAFRVGEAPWSWLHIPGWLAAFAVNFAAAALIGDLQRLRDMFEGGIMGPNDPWRSEHAGDVVDRGGAPAWDADGPPAPTA
jgi:hypothetical protein